MKTLITYKSIVGNEGVRASRLHVVSLQNGLHRQVTHARVFGKVAFGPELVLQHLGKIPDVFS